jgi:hypothetical protein
MALIGRFQHVMRETQRVADRIARMRIARMPGRRTAGASASAGADASGNAYGRWGQTSWSDFTWKT